MVLRIGIIMKGSTQIDIDNKEIEGSPNPNAMSQHHLNNVNNLNQIYLN